MNERLVPLTATLAAQADADGVAGFYVPDEFTILYVSHFLSFANSPTAETIDIQDDGDDIETDIDVSTNGITTLDTPLRVAAGSVIEIDLNLTGGSSPTATGQITLWGLAGE